MRSPLDRIRHHVDLLDTELRAFYLAEITDPAPLNLEAVDAAAEAIRLAVADERARRGRVATAAPPAVFPVPRE